MKRNAIESCLFPSRPQHKLPRCPRDRGPSTIPGDERTHERGRTNPREGISLSRPRLTAQSHSRGRTGAEFARAFLLLGVLQGSFDLSENNGPMRPYPKGMIMEARYCSSSFV